MIALLITLPPELRRSVTPDRGKEFASHPRVSAALDGLPFYFPNPHAPWKRGTNENTNGLIREYCPKSVDMNSFDASYFDDFISRILIPFAGRDFPHIVKVKPHQLFNHRSGHRVE